MADYKRLLRLLIILAVGMVLINLYSLGQVRSLKNDVNDLQGRLDASSGDLRAQINHLRSQLTRLEEEKKLISRMDVAPQEVEGIISAVVFSWQVRDFQSGGNVNFHYRQAGSDGVFASVAAEQGEDLLFRAEAPLKIEPSPFREIRRETAYAGSNARVEGVGPFEPGMDNAVYEYYVSINDGQKVTVTDRETIDLGKLRLYGLNPVEVFVFEHAERGSVDISLREIASRPDAEDKHIKSAFVEVAVKGAVHRLPMNPVPQESRKGVSVYGCSIDDTSDARSIVVEVQYGDGSTYDEQVWEQ